jgi:uncharacterized protein (TIGR02646 family)
MRKIDKLQPPNSLITYSQTTNPNDPSYKPTYEGLDSNVIKDIKEKLLNEQGWVCGYCMQKINKSNMTIEHHCEQSICNGENGTTDRTLHYTNMLAVCQGKTHSEQHCDKQKSKFDAQSGLPMSLSPWERAHMNTISFKSSGQIKSSNLNYDNELNKFLNLNAKFLKDLRGSKFRKIFAASKHSKVAIQKAKMRSILERDLQKTGYSFSNDFPGLSEFMLTNFCS